MKEILYELDLLHKKINPDENSNIDRHFKMIKNLLSEEKKPCRHSTVRIKKIEVLICSICNEDVTEFLRDKVNQIRNC
jgi:hypothetical protein